MRGVRTTSIEVTHFGTAPGLRMSTSTQEFSVPPEISRDRSIDRICRQFEDDWIASDGQIRIDGYVDCDFQADDRQRLIEELVYCEFELLSRHAREFDLAWYQATLADELSVVEAALARCRRAESRRVSDGRQPVVPDRLGDFRILRELGRGGMSVVYEAHQESLGRRVAIKVLPASAVLRPEWVKRFHREARAASRLLHPHIVQIFDTGIDQGWAWHAMPLVDGKPLSEICPNGCGELVYSPKELEIDSEGKCGDAESAADILNRPDHPMRCGVVARIGLQASLALEHAHQQRILHRDIKPSNLLLDRGGNTWLTDFGLAQMDDTADCDLAESDGLLGSVRYLPPEALDGIRDERGDIYGLGMTLYELLVLRPAIDGRTKAELLASLRSGPVPPAPTALNPNISGELERVVVKAICPDPERRYHSAGEMADDLTRFLTTYIDPAEPVSWYRHRVSACVALVSAIAGGLAGVLFS